MAGPTRIARQRPRVGIGSRALEPVPLFALVFLLIGIGLFFPANALAAGTSVNGTSGHLGSIGFEKTTLTYCNDGGVPETLDVYEPDPAPGGAVPVVVYVHGGGWTGGSDEIESGSLVGRVARGILSQGWVFVSIYYRLAPRFVWPAQIVDAKCAIRFLRADARALHVDPGRVAAIGDSAGGQIASLLGLTGADGLTSSGSPYKEESSAVEAVVDLSGPSDLTSASWSGSRLVESLAPRVFGSWLGPAPAGSAAARELSAASPVNYVTPSDPPFLIMQGEDDTVVPPEQSLELTWRLRAVGDRVTLVMVSGAQHEFTSASNGAVVPPMPDLAEQATAFLVRNL